MQGEVTPVGDPSVAWGAPPPAFEGPSSASGAPLEAAVSVCFERLCCTGSAKAVAISECGGLLFAGIANTIRVYEAPGGPQGCKKTHEAEALGKPAPHQGAPLAAVYFSPSEHVLGLKEARGLLVAYGVGRLAAYALRKGEALGGPPGDSEKNLARQGPPKGEVLGTAQAPTGPLVLQQLLLVKERRRIVAAELLFLSPAAATSSTTAAAAAAAAAAPGRCCLRACILLMLSDGLVKLLHLATGTVLLERRCSSGPLMLQAAAAAVSSVQHSTKAESCCSPCCSCCQKGLMQRVELLLAGGTAFADVLLWSLLLDGSVLLSLAAAATPEAASAAEATAAAAAAAAGLEQQPLELVQHLQGHRGGLYSLAFAEQGALLASASEDREIRLWARLPHTAAAATAAAAAAAVAAAATAAAAAPPVAAAAAALAELRRPFCTSNIRATEGAPLKGKGLHKSSYRCVGVLVGHKSRIWGVSFLCLFPKESPSRNLFPQQALQQQQQQQQQEPQEQEQSSQALNLCCRYSSTDEASSASGGDCCCLSCLQLHATSCNLLLLSAGEDSTVRIWSVKGTCLYTLEAHKGRGIRSVAAGGALGAAGGPPGHGGAPLSFFVSGGEDGCIKVWPLGALPSLWGALQEHMRCSSSELLQLMRRWQQPQHRAHTPLQLSPPDAGGTAAAAAAAVMTAASEETLAVYTQQHHNHTPQENEQQQEHHQQEQEQQQQQQQKEQQKQQHAAATVLSSCGATAAAFESVVWSCQVFASSKSPRAAAAAEEEAAQDTPQSAAAATGCTGACAGLGGSSKDFVREVFFWASKETRGDTLLVSTNYGHVYLLSLPTAAEAATATTAAEAAALAKQANATATAAAAAGFRHLLLCCVPSPITATGVSDRCLCLGGADGCLRLLHLPSLEDLQQQQQSCRSRAEGVTAIEAKAFDGVRVSSVFAFSLGYFLSPSIRAAAAAAAGSSSRSSSSKEGTPLVPLSRSSDSSSSIWTDTQHAGHNWGFSSSRGGLAAAGDHTGALQLYVWQQQQQQECPVAAGSAVEEGPLELLRIATLRLPRRRGLCPAVKGSSSSQRSTNRFMCCLSLVSAASSKPSGEGPLLLSAVLLVGDEHGTLHVVLLQVPAKTAAQQQQQQQQEWDWACCRTEVQRPLAELHPRRRVCSLCYSCGFVYCCGGDGRVVILRVSLSNNSSSNNPLNNSNSSSSSSSNSGEALLSVDQQVVVEQLQAVKVSQISTFVGLFPSGDFNEDNWWGSIAAALQPSPEKQGQQQQQQQQQRDGFELLQQHVAVGVRGSDLVGFSFLQEAPLLQLPCGDSKRSFAVCRDGQKSVRLAFSRCECVSVFCSSSSSSSSRGAGQSGCQQGAEQAQQEQQEQQQHFSCVSFNPHHPGGDVHAVVFLSPALICAGSEDNTLKLIACESPCPPATAAAASEGGGDAAAMAASAARPSIDHCLRVLSTTTRHRAAVRAVAELQRWEQQQQQQQHQQQQQQQQALGVSASRLPRLVASAGAAQTLTLYQVSGAAAAGETSFAAEAASAAATAASTDSRCGGKRQFEGLLHLGTLCLEDRNAEGPSANARFTTACGFVSPSLQRQQNQQHQALSRQQRPEQQHELQQQPQHHEHKHLEQRQELQRPQQQQGVCDAFVLIGVSTANLLLIHLSLPYKPEASRAAAAAAADPREREAAGAAAALEPVEGAARAVSELRVVSQLRLPAVPLCSQLVQLSPLETAGAAAAGASAAAAAAGGRGGTKEAGVVIMGLTDGSLACALLQKTDSTSPPLLLPIGTVRVHQRAVTGVCVQVLQQQPAATTARGAAPTAAQDPCSELLRLLVISSGDDDAICLQVLSFIRAKNAQSNAGAAAAAAAAAAGSEQDSSSSRWRMRLLHRVRYPNAHGSSVRCLSLCGPFLFSLGWDRWLQAWRIHSSSSSRMRGDACTLCGAVNAGTAASSACCCRPPLGCFTSAASATFSTAVQRNAYLLDRQLEALWLRRGVSPQLQQEILDQRQLQQKQLQQDSVAFALQRVAAIRTGVAEAAALATCDVSQSGPTGGPQGPPLRVGGPQGAPHGAHEAHAARVCCAGASGGIEIFNFKAFL